MGGLGHSWVTFSLLSKVRRSAGTAAHSCGSLGETQRHRKRNAIILLDKIMIRLSTEYTIMTIKGFHFEALNVRVKGGAVIDFSVPSL